MTRPTSTAFFRKAVLLLTVLGWITPGIELCLAACSPDHALWNLAKPKSAHSDSMPMDAGRMASASCCGSHDDTRSAKDSTGCAGGSCACAVDAAKDGLDGPMAAVAPSNTEPEPPRCATVHEFDWATADTERPYAETIRAIGEPDAPPPPLFLLNVSFLN